MSDRKPTSRARPAESPAAMHVVCHDHKGGFMRSWIYRPAALALFLSPSFGLTQERRVESDVYATFEQSGGVLQLIGLAAGDLLPGTKVTINCTGTSCPFSSKTMNVTNNVKVLAMTDMFVDPTFKPGTTLEIRITRPNSIGRLFQYEIGSSAQPRVTKLCLTPGGSEPVACSRR